MATDLKRIRKELYSARRTPTLVDVPEMRFLMIDGEGAPDVGEALPGAIQALYAVAYTVKFELKKTGPFDFVVPPLEALWWSGEGCFDSRSAPDGWCWTVMIVMPDEVTGADVTAARRAAAAKEPRPALELLRFEPFTEGQAAQVLHVGPYAEEQPTLDRLHRFIADEGYRLRGKHHEIYLGDPSRSAPEKLRTILRQPVEAAEDLGG